MQSDPATIAVLMRHEVLRFAVQELIELLSDGAKSQLAFGLRLRLDEWMEEHADNLTTEHDAQLTRELALLLEPAGVPIVVG